MPANIVKPGEEAAWARAKRTVSAEYPDIAEGSDRYYKLVTTLFQNMKALDPDGAADHAMHKGLRLVVVRRRPGAWA